jgi:hypothetical protein
LAALLLATVQANTPDNVSSRLMVHVSHPFMTNRVGSDNDELLASSKEVVLYCSGMNATELL